MSALARGLAPASYTTTWGTTPRAGQCRPDSVEHQVSKTAREDLWEIGDEARPVPPTPPPSRDGTVKK
jgi:hypothetical protein